MKCSYPGCEAETYMGILCHTHQQREEHEQRENRSPDPNDVLWSRTVRWLFIPLLWAAAFWVVVQAIR